MEQLKDDIGLVSVGRLSSEELRRLVVVVL